MYRFALYIAQKRLAAGLCPNPLEELTALPRHSIKEQWRGDERRGTEGRERNGREREGKGNIILLCPWLLSLIWRSAWADISGPDPEQHFDPIQSKVGFRSVQSARPSNGAPQI